jgi:hypothetical protein
MSVINLCRRLTACCDPLGGLHEDHKDHSPGASSAAALWSVIILICCLAAHVQESAFRVASCSLRPLGNSIYRRTNGPRPSSTYFEPTGKLVGRRVVLCIGTPSHFLTPRIIITLPIIVSTQVTFFKAWQNQGYPHYSPAKSLTSREINCACSANWRLGSKWSLAPWDAA